MKKLETLNLVIQRIFQFIGQMGLVVIILMMLLIVADVAGRYFFNSPIVGSVEIVQLQNIILSFFALVWCTLNLEHTKVTVLETMIPDKIKFLSDTVFYLLGAGFYSFICIQNIKIVREYILKETSTVVLGIPLFPIYFIIAFCCGCVAIILCIAVINKIISMVNK